MDNSLQIALVQLDLAWKDKKQNLEHIDEMIFSLKQSADIFILPELFNTAFCVDDPELAETENGDTVSWMQQLASAKETVICGSLLIRENSKIYNRFLWVDKNGIQYRYDKHYLFSLVNENESHLIYPGNNKISISYENWEIQPFICYDLRFPAWCQNDQNVQVQIFVASWPQKRIHHWMTLLQARAIENQCYTIGVNRIGEDGHGHLHNGHSCSFDYKGDLLCDMQEKNGIEIVALSKEKLEKYRNQYPFWKDR